MNLNRFSKKAIAIAAIGTMMTLGATMPPLVQAADFNNDCPGMYQNHQKMSPEQMAEKMSAHLGISKADFKKYQANGLSPKDIGQAAFLAKASGKTINDVISYKTKNNTWKDVTTALGITKEQIKTTRENLIADHITAQTGTEKSVILNLLGQGYHGKDIMMACELAKNAAKPIDEVLGMKKINNTWRDVATALGVSQETLKQDFKEMHREHRE